MKLTRRKLLVGMGLTAIATCTGVRGFYYGGLDAYRGLAHLSPRLGLILAAVVDGMLPPAADRRPETVLGHVRVIDRFLAAVPAADRDQLAQGLYALEHATLPFGAKLSRFTGLGTAARAEVLESWRTSRLELARLCFRSLKAMVFLAYYRDATAFAAIRYGGPIMPGGSSLPEVNARYAALVARPGSLPRLVRAA